MKYKATIQITMSLILDADISDTSQLKEQVKGWVEGYLIPVTWSIYDLRDKKTEVLKVEEV